MLKHAIIVCLVSGAASADIPRGVDPPPPFGGGARPTIMSITQMAKEDIGTWACDDADSTRLGGALVVGPRFNGTAVHLEFTGVTPRNGAMNRVVEWSIDARQIRQRVEATLLAKEITLTGETSATGPEVELFNPYEKTEHPLQRLRLVPDSNGLRLDVSIETWHAKDKQYVKGLDLRCDKLP